MHITPAKNLQREGRSLPREGRGPLFQWDVGISVGFFTKTTGSLRNPDVPLQVFETITLDKLWFHRSGKRVIWMYSSN